MPKPQGPPEVLTTKVIQRDVPVYQEWIGNLDGSVNTQVRARVSGYLISQNYKEGSLVKAGELLFQIDPRPLVAALHQAQGDLAKADATEKLEAMNLKRARELFAGKVTSSQERDTSVASYGTSKADVMAQMAAVETARLNVEFAQITSPVDGIAGIANGQIGDLVGPNSAQTGPLTTISVVDPIKAYFTITEQDYITFARRLADANQRRELNPKTEVDRGDLTQSAGRENLLSERAVSMDTARSSSSLLGSASCASSSPPTSVFGFKKDLELELILADGSVYPCKGRFDFADRQVDITTGAMRVAGVFANPGHFLRPGLFCRVRAQTDVRTGALLVPVRAISEVQGSYQVAVVGPDRKATIRPVELGEVQGAWRVVTKGVKAGESVVVEGLQKVRDGSRVEPKEWRGVGEDASS